MKTHGTTKTITHKEGAMKVRETAVLKRARETYGNKNQILVCIEELNELACVLAKYPRYENEHEAVKNLHDSVLDEVADVLIILDHIQAILNLSDEEVIERIGKKIDRLDRWLNDSSSMQRTLEDRAVGSVDCKTCENWKNPDYTMCKTCMSTEGTEGIRPFYKRKAD